MIYNEELTNLVLALEKGSIALCPTDSIWGLSCDAHNAKAVEKLAKIKKRKIEKSFILLVSNEHMLSKYVSYVHPKIHSLIEFHTRPVTVIYDNPVEDLPTYLLGPKNTIGIRIVNYPFLKDVIEKLGRPIISTSANESGQPTAPNFEDISPKILKAVDFISKYDQTSRPECLPSVIVRLNEGSELEFLRE